jgi:hypothetical protein
MNRELMLTLCRAFIMMLSATEETDTQRRAWLMIYHAIGRTYIVNSK